MTTLRVRDLLTIDPGPPVWSRQLAVGDGARTVVHHPTTDETAVVIESVAAGERRVISPRRQVSKVALAPDGSLVGLGAGDVVLREGPSVQALAGHHGQRVAFSPTGDRVALSEPGVRVVELPACRTLASYEADYGELDAIALAFSPDGTQVAAYVGDRLHILAAQGSERIGAFDGAKTGAVAALRWDEAGLTVATDFGRIIHVDGSGTIRRQQLFDGQLAYSVALLADGLVAFGNGAVQVYDCVTGTRAADLPGEGQVQHLAADPSGRVLVAAWSEGPIIGWAIERAS